MGPEYIVMGFYAIATIGVFFYQANRYSALERSLKALNDMLDSINKYKDIFKPDDIIERMNTKHQLDKENLEGTWQKQMAAKIDELKIGFSKEMAPKVANEFVKMNNEIIEKYSELTLHPIKFIITSPDFKDNKDLRDKFIKANFPKNYDYFVEACDRLLLNEKEKK
jgi:hypothetical protein